MDGVTVEALTSWVTAIPGLSWVITAVELLAVAVIMRTPRRPRKRVGAMAYASPDGTAPIPPTIPDPTPSHAEAAEAPPRIPPSPAPETPMTKASDLFIACLEEEGVECVFGVPGEENLDVLDSLSRSSKIKLILTRHEQGAGFMAAT